MNDAMEEAGLGVEPIHTEPADLDEEKRMTEAVASWPVLAVFGGCLIAGVAKALGWW